MSYLEKDTLTETYKDMERLICSIVWKFCERYNAEFQEIKAKADLLFVQAMKEHDSKESSVSTWVTIYISGNLQKYFCKEWKRVRTRSIDLSDPQSFSIPNPTPLIDIIDEVQDDAKTLIQLVLETPSDLLDAMINTNSICLGACIKRYVINTLCWSTRKYKDAFNEVTHALQT